MSFYIRKSIKAGPFRFNLSKSGIGVSAGIKGLRVGTGPAGNYIHMGRGGLYYRKTFKNPAPANATPVNNNAPEEFRSMATNPEYSNFREIESGDVTNMTDSSSAELLAEFDSKQRKIRIWPFLLALSVLGFFILPPQTPDWVYPTIFGIEAILVYLAYNYDEIRKSVILFYAMEPEFEKSYEELHQSFSTLSSARRIWHVAAAADVRDRKRNAGASQVVSKKVISIGNKGAPFVKTNINVPSIPVGRQTLYFFPDRVLVYDSNKVGAISYKDLDIDIGSIRFIESESVPSDAKVVDQTWRFVNKSGGPDRRFNNNRQLPICLYEETYLKSGSGLNELIQISRCGLSISLRIAVEGLARALNSGNHSKDKSSADISVVC